jgi:hypothetical protein
VTNERLWWTLVGCILMNWSVQLLSATTSVAWVTVAVVLTGGWGLCTVVVSWLPSAEAAQRRYRVPLGWLTAVLVVAAFVVWAYIQVRSSPGYGTDELAFDQYAGQLARHGINPYLRSMAPSFSLFRVSPDGYSYDLAGHAITSLSYPALSFLIYVPLLLLGLSAQLAVGLNVAAWGATVLLMFALLPSRIRPVALVVGSVGVYVSYAVGGITDVLYMPLLVVAAYRWDRFGERRRSYLGPIALGLAMAVKQTPWLLLPFIVYALAIDEHARAGARAAVRRATRYVCVVAVAFLVPNAYYILFSPSRWLYGIETPVASHLVPAGQGVVALSLFLRLGGGSLNAFSVAGATLGLLLLLLYAGTYPRLRPATFILPAIVLFFASRSYGSYLVSLIPSALVGAATCVGGSVRAPRIWYGSGETRRRFGVARAGGWTTAIAVGLAVFGAAVAYALSDRQPLRVRIVGIRTTGQLATIQQVRLRVHNASAHPVRAAFTIDEGGQVTTFWRRIHGPRSLAPGHTAQYTITAPNYPAEPSIAGGFTVMAFSRGPAAVSSTGPYEPSTLHVALTPAAVNAPVLIGRPVVIHADLLDQLDTPVHRAGVPVYLGQIIYDQSGLELAQATINSHAPGQTPVLAYTNANGVATFVVVGTQPDGDPVYFEANLVQTRLFYPYGYSQILPLQFRAR